LLSVIFDYWDQVNKDPINNKIGRD
jgi:hypothetical protein